MGAGNLEVRYLDGNNVPLRYKVRRAEGQPPALSVLREMEAHPEAPWEVRDRLLQPKEAGDSHESPPPPTPAEVMYALVRYWPCVSGARLIRKAVLKASPRPRLTKKLLREGTRSGLFACGPGSDLGLKYGLPVRESETTIRGSQIRRGDY
jgi:hypothetical protein